MEQVAASVSRLVETHGLVTRPGTRIWASSEGLGWRSVFATAQREAPFHGDFDAIVDPLVVIHLTGPVRVGYRLAGAEESAMVLPGGAFVLPGGVPFGVRLAAPLETVHFYLHRALVDEVADELATGGQRAELIPRLGKPDPLLEQIGLAFREQLHDGSVSTSLYVDHLARAAAARLVSAHSTATLRVPPGERRAGLSEQQLRRAVDFMEANLDRDSSIAELAAAAGLSPVYFARQFKVATGFAPHQYLLRLRVERAKRLLSTADLPIAAIALDCGFCHQEHLTRVFHRVCGTTPAAYRAALRS